MDRAEAVKILEIQLDVTSVNTPSCIELHEALDLAIEALKEPTGDYEFFGGTYAKESDAEPATTTDCISRKQAIEALTGWQTDPSDEDIVRQLNALPPVTPKEQTDCTDFINWLLAEVLDEENWELNAVANGEIICRKLKKLDLLEVKDGYYVRASVTPTERTGEWKYTMTYYPYCSECDWMPEEDEMRHGHYDYCPNCGAKMGGGME